jgi:hypothetical protein
MGEEIQISDVPHFHVKVIGTAPLQAVTLVRNGVDHVQWAGTGRELELEYGNTERPQATDYYYVRVIQNDGEMAWSSPIWITCRGRK